MKNQMLFVFAAIHTGCNMPKEDLKISLLKEKPTENIIAFYDKYNNGGNTSVANDDANIFVWSGETVFENDNWGYFDSTGNEIPYIKRDRDLGQTFRINNPKTVTLKSVTVRTGFGTNAIREGMYGQRVSIQVFEVTGEPKLHDNGTVTPDEAFHGFPHNRLGDSIPAERDDYFSGEIYTSLAIFRGGIFPYPTDFGFSSNDTVIDPNHELIKGRYLKLTLPEKPALQMEPGKQYAFLLMIDNRGKKHGFTLANEYNGSYPDGHGIRRDGNGIFPPVPAKPKFDFSHQENNKAMISAHFPDDFKLRTAISPGTNGYPDVCTWRDLEFYIEGY